MGQNIKECEEFHQKMIQLVTHGLLQIKKEDEYDVVGMISY
jgi:uncharacterized protein YjfI (DUF2170 family)